MKTTSWLGPVLTLLCATKLVYTAQRESYGDYLADNTNSQMLQNDYFLSKRNKPSLSIVNPLDVLRQRLLLEIARRQMKENTRQVELNRAILNNVGKRMASKHAPLYDAHELQHQQLEPMQYLQPYEYELIPTTLFFDYLQQQQQQQQQQAGKQEQEQQQQQQQRRRRPWLPYETSALPFDNNYINDAIFSLNNGVDNDEPETGMENAEQDMIAFNDNNDKHSNKHIKQSNDEHSNGRNEQSKTAAFQKSISASNDDIKRFALINNHQLRHQKNNFNLDLNDAHPVVVAKPNASDYKQGMNNNDGDYQIQRYLNHLHKNQNHLTRK